MGYIQPEFFTNIFEINLEPGPYCIIYDSKVFRDPLSKIVRFIRRVQDLSGKVYSGIADRYLIVFAREEDAISECKNVLLQGEVFRPELKGRQEKYIGPFFKVPDELKEVSARILGNCLYEHVLKSLYDERWIIVSGIQKYRAKVSNESLKEELEEPFNEIVELYKGLNVAVNFFWSYNARGQRNVKIGLVLDYAVILIPIASIYDLIKRNLEYRESSVLELNEIEHQFGYRTKRYIVWDLAEPLNPEKESVSVERLEKRGIMWDFIPREFNLRAIYPLRRPEVIDQICGRRGDLTRRVKVLSFQITEEGKRDTYAPRKRSLFVMDLLKELRAIISNKELLKMKVDVAEEPLGVYKWGLQHWL
ncbi:MAG: hypothetical protein QXH96_01665 [Candidatus Geothermarchaeota archaeon]